MRRGTFGILLVVGLVVLTLGHRVLGAGPGDWPYWRGPAVNGMAIGDAPLTWSGTDNVAWKTDIPGPGQLQPRHLGRPDLPDDGDSDGRGRTERRRRIPPQRTRSRRRIRAAAQSTASRSFRSIAKRARSSGSAPPRPPCRTKGLTPPTAASPRNSPVTDGKYVYAFFGSRGMYVYDLKGTLVWQKDFGVQLRM